MHAHNPYHANDQSYAFDVVGHGHEALPQTSLVRNRALDVIELALNSGFCAYSAFIKPEHVAGVRLALDHHKNTTTHHMGVVSADGGHTLRVVRRRHA